MLNTDRLCPGCMNDNGGEQICSVCGYDSSEKNASDKLPVHYMLSDRYLIGKAISSNAESTVYMAWDNSANIPVHIKEYFPKDASVRNSDKTVSVKSGSEFIFNEGLIDFIEINKKLIGTELPSIIPTFTVFEENGTVYCVNQVVSGISLQSFLDRNGGSLRWEQARALFLPLIDTVKGLHEQGIIHGGISPETILVGRDGKLRLTDICIPTLRRVSSDSPAILYSGYAAVEQYGKQGLSVGDYTDVYALSATLFRVLIGAVPPVADQRLENDTLSIPAKFADELPRQVLVAIANGMQVLPENRTENMDVFRNEMVYGETQENIRRAAVTQEKKKNAASSRSAEKDKKSAKNAGIRYAAISAGVTAALFAVVALILCLTVFRNDIFGGENLPIDDTSDYASMPEIESIGDVDSDAVESTILYTVPDFSGKYYSQIIDNEEYERFKITVKSKEYSDKYARGTVCGQSLEAGKEVENETEIQLVISLGPQEITVADVVGHDEMSAKVELLRQGFLYENIEVVDKYDSEAKPGVVLEQVPASGEKVNTESVVRIFINSYEGETFSDDSATDFQ